MAKANHAAGGQLIYEWISDSTYRIFFKYYRDCAGDTAPATFTVCLHNTCTNVTTSSTMTKFYPTGTGPGFSCSQSKTTCDSPASAVNGAIQWWYSAIVTLPSCNLWRFYVYGGHRSNTANLQNATNTVLYLESTLNNSAQFMGNSSPYFAISGYAFTCVNSTFYYNAGAIDPDGDSLVTEIVNPMTGTATCGAGLVNVPLASSSPSLNITNNPLPANNSFTLNAQTGQMTFTPSQVGMYSLLIRVTEYRSGIFVGSVMNEVRLQVLPCTPFTLAFKVDTNNVSGGTHIKDTIIGCPGQTLNFCWWVKASDTNAYLVLQDNHIVNIPAANIIYTKAAQKGDSVRACMMWTPNPTDTGLKGIYVTIIDSGCRPGKFATLYYYNKTVVLKILAPTLILKDTSICPNSAAHLKTNQNTGNFTWSVLSGTSGSLSCTTCANPIVTPSFTSQYEVVTTANAYCGHNKDTVTVTVLPNTYPSINATVAPDSNLIKGQSQVFHATANNCSSPIYQWALNGIDVPGATINQWSSPPRLDGDKVFCKLSCSDICPLPVDTFSNTITMHITDTTNGIGTFAGESEIKLYPNPNDGSFIVSELRGKKGKIEILNILGQVVYKDELTGNNKKQVKMNRLEQGHYLLRIQTGNEIITKRFVLQH
jgi:hypothetical protein